MAQEARNERDYVLTEFIVAMLAWNKCWFMWMIII